MSGNLDASKQTTKWVQGMQQKAPQAYRDAINAYQGYPMAQAVAKKAKWINGLQSAFSNGSWEKGLQAADPNSWKQNALNVGADRLSTGATKKQAKYQAKTAAYHAFLGPILSQINSMPDDTKAQRVAKGKAYLDATSQYKQGS